MTSNAIATILFKEASLRFTAIIISYHLEKVVINQSLWNCKHYPIGFWAQNYLRERESEDKWDLQFLKHKYSIKIVLIRYTKWSSR